MADFEKAYYKTIGAKNSNEGGYALVAGDKGGETYRGIARKYHPTWKGWAVVDAFKKANGGKIKYNFIIPDANLEKLVKEFYRANFWNKIGGDKILSQGLAENFFDMHVNSGSAVKIMQRALNKLGLKVDVDNAFGIDTLAAINKADPSTLNKYYLQGRKEHYDTLVKNDPSQEKFYDGWLARLKHFPDATTAAAAGISSIALFVGAGLVYYFFFNK